MSTSKQIEKICVVAVVVALLLTVVLANGERLGIQAASKTLGYETRLFSTTQVHTIDIVMDDWDAFLAGCEDEQYVSCAVVIDNEAYKNVGIRAKGNTSLSSVSQLNSQRYSFKIEFDHYDNSKTYYGLDKLNLNNLIQDNTMLKDYLTYQMMGAFGVDAPLCSFVYITVNGEDWGLYLAVEGVEDAFLQRNYGNTAGDLYKPDSLSMGGGPGGGQDFDMNDLADLFGGQDSEQWEEILSTFSSASQMNTDQTQMPEIPSGDGAQMPEMPSGDTAQMPEIPSGDGAQMPEIPSGDGAQMPEMPSGDTAQMPEIPSGDGAQMPGFPGENFGGGGGFEQAMGSDDAKLQYIDDDPDSYSTIFDNAKTNSTQADQLRLIAALKALSEGDVENSVNIDKVLRYFVVHNFVVNGDSYTGSMIHNYYLYESDGILSMLPWDYNLAFGGFQASSASAVVNDPIDTPLSVTGDGTRPMVDWIFQNEEYTALYHEYFAEFLQTVDVQQLIDDATALITPYVERDPTKFCTYEEFQLGVTTLKEFCRLRVESVEGQLDGAIPSTSAGQRTAASALVDASAITISDMGSMNSTMGGMDGGRGEGGSRGESGRGEDGGFRGEQPGTDGGESGQSSTSAAQPEKPDTDANATATDAVPAMLSQAQSGDAAQPEKPDTDANATATDAVPAMPSQAQSGDAAQTEKPDTDANATATDAVPTMPSQAQSGDTAQPEKPDTDANVSATDAAPSMPAQAQSGEQAAPTDESASQPQASGNDPGQMQMNRPSDIPSGMQEPGMAQASGQPLLLLGISALVLLIGLGIAIFFKR